MERATLYCKGKTLDGRPCSSWAVEGSNYCQLHQDQETKQYFNEPHHSHKMRWVAVVAFLVIAFFITFLGR